MRDSRSEAQYLNSDAGTNDAILLTAIL